MADVLIRQVDDDEGRAPGSRTVTDEAELQQILATSPNLLPGPGDIPLVAVQEFPLSSGRVDIVAVAADETIVLEIVALELGHVRDGDVEMMIPVVYGEEAVVSKRRERAIRWNEEEPGNMARWSPHLSLSQRSKSCTSGVSTTKPRISGARGNGIHR